MSKVVSSDRQQCDDLERDLVRYEKGEIWLAQLLWGAIGRLKLTVEDFDWSRRQGRRDSQAKEVTFARLSGIKPQILFPCLLDCKLSPPVYAMSGIALAAGCSEDQVERLVRRSMEVYRLLAVGDKEQEILHRRDKIAALPKVAYVHKGVPLAGADISPRVPTKRSQSPRPKQQSQEASPKQREADLTAAQRREQKELKQQERRDRAEALRNKLRIAGYCTSLNSQSRSFAYRANVSEWAISGLMTGHTPKDDRVMDKIEATLQALLDEKKPMLVADTQLQATG